MNAGIRKLFQQVTDELNFKIDERSGSLLGEYGGYHFTVFVAGNTYYVRASIRKNGQLPDKSFQKEIRKYTKGIGAVSVKNNLTVIQVKGLTMKKVGANIIEAIRNSSELFRANGYQNVCSQCGEAHPSMSFYGVSGVVQPLCSSCQEKIGTILQQKQAIHDETPENVLGGILGALGGSLIGALAIVIIGEMGYVASVSGLIMGICTMKGYEKFGKKLSNKGVIISSIIMVIMTYLGYKIEMCMDIADALIGWSTTDVFLSFGDLLQAADAYAEFFGGLALVYLFTVLGAVPTVKNIMAERDSAFESYEVE